jgi:hypothetical protein
MVNTVRDGQKVVPTCSECGCRLEDKGGVWLHFLNWDHTKDARGCKCKNLNKSWMKTVSGFQRYITFTNVTEY